MPKIILVMGSKSDLEFCQKIGETVKEFGVRTEYRIASAHRNPKKVLQIAEQANASKEPIVFVAVAGLSNALSGMLSCATHWPVVSCPPYNPEDVWSSLRMPAGVAHATVLGEQNAALMAVKILACNDASLRNKIGEFLKAKVGKVERDDQSIQT